MSRAPLADRLAALDVILAEGDGRLDQEALTRARQVREKASERLARGDDAVVAALCGGTGGGKSSLFNALAGAALAPTGVRRPTTADVRALAVGDQAATGAVCDWLGVAHRHHVEATPALPDGLVLLDLPDTDSVAEAHRLLAARFVERVDLLVWVTDPIKYAHRWLHETFLRRLAAHAEVMVVVLNRIDELSDEDRRTCLDDLRRLLAEEGLSRARVLPTSARTGEGVEELRRLLADEARRRRAAAVRISADVRTIAAALRDEAGAAPAADIDEAALVGALAGAAGVPQIGAAAAGVYRRDALTATRGLPGRAGATVIGRLAAPLRAARGLAAGRRDDHARPAATTAPLVVRRALSQVASSAAGAAPPPAQRRLRALVEEAGQRLPRRLAAAVDGVRVAPPRRRWWRPLALLLTLVELCVVVGALWLGVLAALDALLLPTPPTPMVSERLSWPTALLLGGALLRVLVGVVRRRLVARGAARHRHRVERRLRAAVETVALDVVVEPVRAELAAQARLAEALARAAE